MLIIGNIKKHASRLCPVMPMALLVFVVSGCTTIKISKVEFANIRLDSSLTVAANPKVESVIAPYREKLSHEMGEVLCTASDALFGGRPESLLTNFCADLLRLESDSMCLKKYPDIHIDIAMANSGGLRVPIPKGEVKMRNMFELMPFENEVVFLKMNGTEFKRFIDHIASRGGDGVSGMRLGIKDGKGINPEIQGKPFDDTKGYWLATSDYIANGGDGYEVLKGVKERVATGLKIRDMFIGHLRKLGRKGIAIGAKLDGRVYEAK